MSRLARLCVVLLLPITLMPSISLAAGIPDKIVPCTGVDCTVCDIATVAQNVLNMGIFLAVFASAFLFAWAGVKMLTGGDHAGSRSEAKKIFYNVMVGLICILAAWLLVDTIMATFTGSHLWNKLC